MSQKPNFGEPSESNPSKTSVAERTATTNEEGAPAFDAFTPEHGLYMVVIGNLVEETYYDSVDEQMDKLWTAYDSVADANPEFVLKLATYARQVEGLRDVPQILLVMAANDERVTKPDDASVSWVRDYTPAIIDRVDEINTVLSYQIRGYGKPVPNGVQKGIGDKLNQKYAMVEVVYGGTSETERVTWIDGVENESDAEFRAAVRVLDRNGYSVDDAETANVLDTADTELVDSGFTVDTYTAKKYLARNKDISLFDVLNLVRPNPRSENREELFERIARGELDESGVEPLREDRTWESTRSDDDDDRSEAEQWRDRIDDMGLMARLRNVRNMREAGLDGAEIFDYDQFETGGGYGVFDENSANVVRNSKIFPFRIYQAWKAAKDVQFSSSKYSDDVFRIGSGNVLDDFSEEWLQYAINTSTDNLPDAMENTFTAVDLSGSMDQHVSGDSELKCNEIASLFGAMTLKRSSDVGVFASDFRRVVADETALRTNSTLDLTEEIVEAGSQIGGSTNGYLALEWAIEERAEYDRFVFLTDMQLWDSLSIGSSKTLRDAFDRYKRIVNEDAVLYTVDLASYGTLQFPETRQDVVQISGWSDEVLELIDRYERGDAICDEIEDVSPNDC